MYAIIMAGGEGSRLWPLSRKKTPKHLLSLPDSLSLLQLTYRRIISLIPLQNIFVVTQEGHLEKIKKQLPELSEDNFISEPRGRNTAPAVGLATLHIFRKDPSAVTLVLPADHYLEAEDDFRSLVKSAAKFVAKNDYLLTWGIKPTCPASGYGYIKAGTKQLAVGNAGDPLICKADKFIEKPSKELAERFISEGNYFWNSGIFIWRAEVILDGYQRYLPGLYENLKKFIAERDPETKKKIYENLEKISLDQGIMERAEKVAVIPAQFGWSDLGTLDLFLKVAGRGQLAVGREEITIYCPFSAEQLSKPTANSQPANKFNNIVHSPKKLVALVGVNDLIVVETEDALLILNKSHLQEIKKVVQELKTRGMEEYL